MADELRSDIARAAETGGVKLGAKREMRKLVEHLWEQESVELLCTGTYGSGTGLVALTTQRLLFLKDGHMSKTSEDFPFAKITSIQWSSGMLMGTITIFASGNKAEIKNVSKDAGKRMTDQVRQLISAPHAAVNLQPVPVAAPTVDAGDDMVSQIERLGQLHQQGILDDEEFAAAKAKLLGS